MQNPRRDIHRVNTASEGREDKDCVEKVGNFGHASLHDGDNENGACTDRGTVAIDERVVHGDNKRCGEHGQRIQRNDTKVDFASGHFHALDVTQCSALCRCSCDDIHADIRGHDTRECCPMRGVLATSTANHDS